MPTNDGKTVLGDSSPANPALHISDPLSMTIAEQSLSQYMARKVRTLLLECREKWPISSSPLAAAVAADAAQMENVVVTVAIVFLRNAPFHSSICYILCKRPMIIG